MKSMIPLAILVILFSQVSFAGRKKVVGKIERKVASEAFTYSASLSIKKISLVFLNNNEADGTKYITVTGQISKQSTINPINGAPDVVLLSEKDGAQVTLPIECQAFAIAAIQAKALLVIDGDAQIDVIMSGEKNFSNGVKFNPQRGSFFNCGISY